MYFHIGIYDCLLVAGFNLHSISKLLNNELLYRYLKLLLLSFRSQYRQEVVDG